ncbi:MAG: tetratricopeptide repeat protein [Spirochaetales bacterium]|jgi:tetratricopeptide (TPR) repeat protein|nr:tetratricopeptide repeat protein [Exilispira sp.]NMC66685.1 tetratricopeptide repeat protein [Spirochaetales bacterium]
MKRQYHTFNILNCFIKLLVFFLAFINISLYTNAQDFDQLADWEKLYLHNLYNATIFQINNIQDISSDLKNYVIGTCYYFIGDYDLAEYYLKQVSTHLFKYKHDPVAFYLGIIYFFKNDFLISATYFNEISANYDSLIEAGKFIYYFSLALIEIGKQDLALKFLKIGLESNYDFYKQYYSFTIAKIYYNLQDYLKAASEFENFLYLYSDSSLADDTLYYLGKSYYNLKDFKNAKKAFSSIINLYRNSEYYYSSLFYLGQITGNKIYLEEIILKNQSFDLIDYVYYYLAKLYYEENQNDKAYQYFTQSFIKTKNQLLKYNCIVYIIKIKGDIPISYLEELNPNQRKPILQYILSNYFYFKQYDKILEYEKSAFSKEILSDPVTLGILGKTYLETQDISKALNFFLEALKYNPLDYKLYFFIGYCYYRLEDYENAQKLFNKVILENGIEPYYGYYSYLYLGILELKKGNYKNSSSFFEQILLKYPTFKSIGEVYYFMSIVYYNLKDFRKALSAIEFAYASNILGKMRLAIISQYAIVMMRFDLEKTQQLFNEYENVSDNNSSIYSLAIKIAEYYFSLNKYDLSLYFYDKALKYCEQQYQKLDITLQLISIYYNTQKYETAFLILKDLVDQDIDYRKKDILFYYFNVAIQMKNLEAASLILKLNNLQIKDYSNFIIQFLSIFKEKNQFNEAVSFIDKLLNNFNDLDSYIKYELMLNKALILMEMNKVDQAFDQFQKIYQLFDDKQKDLEPYLIDCAIKIKYYDFLIQKIPVLFSYNDQILDTNSFYLILKLYFIGKIDEQFIKGLNEKNLIKQDDIRFTIFFIYINNKLNIKKQQELLKPYLTSKNSTTTYWARLFYSIALFESKDYKNSKLLLESLIQFSDDMQKELIYYFLYLIENQEGKEKKYWDILIKEYPFSLFI